MNFSDPKFLYLFLPIVLGAYLILPKKAALVVLLIASTVFLGIAQPYYLVFFLSFIIANYFLGRLIQSCRDSENYWSKLIVWGAVGINAALLLLFKLAPQFLASTTNPLVVAEVIRIPDPDPDWIFPLAFSYISFQVISYHIDIFNEITDAENNLIRFANYILFFPKMMVGPIQRYADDQDALRDPAKSLGSASAGLRRFIVGLSKKVIIADTLAVYVNAVFSFDDPTLNTSHAWIMLFAMVVQLYVDFSGYSDMAIGLAEVLGFKYRENFNYPYLAMSVAEFWRRWHISLTSWFRDYIFTPLQFAIRKQKWIPKFLPILVVFFLTGFWHGKENHYLVWGSVLGIAISIESGKFGKYLKKLPVAIQRVWTLFWILGSWVLFRSPNVSFSIGYLKNLVGIQGTVPLRAFSESRPYPIFQNSFYFSIIVGVILMFPVSQIVQKHLEGKPRLLKFASYLRDFALLLLLIYSMGLIANQGPLPGIYEKF